MYDAVKFDPLLGGTLAAGHRDELDGLAPIGNAAEAWRDEVAAAEFLGRWSAT